MTIDYTLYAITEDRIDDQLGIKVEQALRGGATLVQLRLKGRSTRTWMETATRVRMLTRRFGVPLIINDRVDVMLAADADGVHIGDDDMPPEIARKLIGPHRILGVSAATPVEARQAVAAGADYLGVGATYGSLTKPDAGPAIGVAGVRIVAQSASVPVVAIGGIDHANCKPLYTHAKVPGIAVISSLFGAENVEDAARRYIGIAQAARVKHPSEREPA